MKILITTRHIDLSLDARQNIESRITKALKNILDDIIDVNVTVSAEKSIQSIEIQVQTKHTTFRCLEKTHDLMLSLDKAVDVLSRQIKKSKEKLQQKRRKTSITDDMDSPFLEEPIKSKDTTDFQIVKTNKFAPKPMSIEEAFMQLTLSPDQFIVFFNSQTNQVNVLYRRKDKTIGLIEPSF
jgi:putative sigma-54 modulation protein